MSEDKWLHEWGDKTATRRMALGSAREFMLWMFVETLVWILSEKTEDNR